VTTLTYALLADWSVRQKLNRVSSVQFRYVALYAPLATDSAVVSRGTRDMASHPPKFLAVWNMSKKNFLCRKIFVQQGKVWDWKRPFWENLGQNWNSEHP